jgi:4'-phosphopantetheinyl transferase
MVSCNSDPFRHQEGAPKLLSGIDLRIYVAYSEHAVSARLEHMYLAMMPAKHRATIVRYKRWQDRQATLFGRLLLLRALRLKYPGAGMQKFQSLEATGYGKPFIHGEPEFNISHSDGMVVVAVAKSGSLGIDVEKIRTINLDDFSQDLPEVAKLRENNDADHVDALFFDCWTRKEAVLKGCGKGLMAPLEHVVLKEDTALLCDTAWFIKRVPVDEKYCCHVATDQPLEHITVEYVNLMNGDILCGAIQ